MPEVFSLASAGRRRSVRATSTTRSDAPRPALASEKTSGIQGMSFQEIDNLLVFHNRSVLNPADIFLFPSQLSKLDTFGTSPLNSVAPNEKKTSGTQGRTDTINAKKLYRPSTVSPSCQLSKTATLFSNTSR